MTLTCTQPTDLLASQALVAVQNDHAAWWLFDLQQPPVPPTVLHASLSPRERARAASLTPKAAVRLTTSYGLLRHLLAQRLGLTARQVPLTISPTGKPRLASQPGIPSLGFNLSHSGHFMAIALSEHHEVGIDIEMLRERQGREIIAERFFTTEERDWLSNTPDEKASAFQRLWTAKEAYSKALGRGLGMPWNTFTLTPPPHAFVGAWQLNHPGQTAEEWSITTVHHDAAATIALALGSPTVSTPLGRTA
uniref:4'-phosphopantetheinyl transferase superfamily protein n=1 Tax=Streptomyces sp. NBC_00003 TaxID=2903608 RepID=A0AAU2VBR4_9ACTN